MCNVECGVSFHTILFLVVHATYGTSPHQKHDMSIRLHSSSTPDPSTTRQGFGSSPTAAGCLSGWHEQLPPKSQCARVESATNSVLIAYQPPKFHNHCEKGLGFRHKTKTTKQSIYLRAPQRQNNPNLVDGGASETTSPLRGEPARRRGAWLQAGLSLFPLGRGWCILDRK